MAIRNVTAGQLRSWLKEFSDDEEILFHVNHVSAVADLEFHRIKRRGNSLGCIELKAYLNDSHKGRGPISIDIPE
jgi:hypothetical protein